jgi:hypothetical protein
MLRDIWPAADLVILPPFPRCFENRRQRPIAERVTGDIRDLADRLGAGFVDTPKLLGRDRSLRGATGYNLNGRGAQLVGEELALVVLARSSARAFRKRARLLRGLAVG